MGSAIMPLVRIDDLSDVQLAEYRDVPDPVLLRERGVFVAEGRLVVRALLTNPRFVIRSLLVTAGALDGLRDLLDPDRTPVPVFLASKDLISDVVGFNVHRGCLAIGERPATASAADLVVTRRDRSLFVVLEAVGNADNIGGIFRNSAAFGVDAVLLSPGCADPLYRKAIRVSIGGSLAVPYGSCREWPHDLARLHQQGFTIVALTPARDAVDLGVYATAPTRPVRLALLAGSEGGGLSSGAIAVADVRVRIPMAPGADSLNVATAVGIALHRLADGVS